MLTNANKGTYLVQKWPKIANVIYERPLIFGTTCMYGIDVKKKPNYLNKFLYISPFKVHN